MYRKLIDEMIGKKFNYLTVLEARPDNKKGMVKVQCECGKIFTTRGRSIKSNVTKSCGCKRHLYARRGPRLEGNNPALNAIFSLYRTKAINHNKEWELNKEEFEKITKMNCFYCNSVPSNVSKKHNYEYIYSGIDRVDNEKGYTKDNIVPCCYECNTKKGAITKDILLKIYNFLFKDKDA